MKHLSYKTVRSTIEKIVGIELSESTGKKDQESHPVILNWEKLIIANKIETKFGIVINDESLDKANSIDDIIQIILDSRHNKHFHQSASKQSELSVQLPE